MSEEKNYTVLVTGFGPFQGFPVNFSWETVKNLWSFEWPSRVKLITRELPVVYDIVSKQVPELWSEVKPDLVVHLGVHGGATNIFIETQSFNKNYCTSDITNKCPNGKCCKPGGQNCLATGLNVKDLCEYTNALCEKEQIESRCKESNDPGSYLCGFTYYLSLSQDNSKSLFVHVPPDEVYDTKDMAQAVRHAILRALKQLYNFEC